MLTYLLIQWRHIVTMSHNTFHSSRVIDKRQRRRLANVDIQLRHLVTIRSPNSFHSGHLAITVTLRGPDGDRYGQVLLYYCTRKHYVIIPLVFFSAHLSRCSDYSPIYGLFKLRPLFVLLHRVSVPFIYWRLMPTFSG